MTDSYFDNDSFMRPIATLAFSVTVHFGLVEMPAGISTSREDVYIFKPVAHLVKVSCWYLDIDITSSDERK
jgi:hypothetical protein